MLRPAQWRTLAEKKTMDSEGKVTGEGGKGKDVGTVATTTVTGAGIGAIAGGGKGAGIGGRHRRARGTWRNPAYAWTGTRNCRAARR